MTATLDSTVAREWAIAAVARAQDAGAPANPAAAEHWLDQVEPLKVCLLRTSDYARWDRVREQAVEQFVDYI
jgi:hypothetical protein